GAEGGGRTEKFAAMKIIWTIPFLLLPASPLWGAFPKMESTSFVITSSELSSMGKYKKSSTWATWDTLGQPSPIGEWPAAEDFGGNNSGAGWAYTINLPVFWDKDRDRDGMPTAYENQFDDETWSPASGLSDYNPIDAIIDGDGDDFYNIQEFLARTDPTDDTSFFQFTDIRVGTSAGQPVLMWRNPTISIQGFESEYPDYIRSLAFDVLYADWSRASQSGGQFPNSNWFNLTGTWQLHPNATGLLRTGDFNYFTETTLTSLQEGDIRFYRLAIAGTYLEGEPSAEAAGTWRYYTEMGSFRLASTLAKEVMMVQRRDIPAGETQVMLGLAGNVPGSGGVLNYALGTAFFPSGSLAAEATKFNLWQAQPGSFTMDYLSGGGAGWKVQSTFDPSTRTIAGSDGFRLVSPNTQTGFPETLTFYAGAALKMDSYFNQIHHRTWNDQTVRPGDPDFDEVARITFLNYNFPVSRRFNQTSFPDLAGTTSPLFPGWAWLESDWLVLYDRDLSAIGGRSNEPVVVIYQDHSSASEWKYLTPAAVMGTSVGNELTFSAGSPAVVMQYWNPDEPVTWNSNTFAFAVPYQNSGANGIKTYLKYIE
ncbi:MAG: hypothetical protein P9M08_10730, partial [Candidatus Erginobacter occultus]|nr:hypothetical protein [Candidatus Erginobacter occultus]